MRKSLLLVAMFVSMAGTAGCVPLMVLGIRAVRAPIIDSKMEDWVGHSSQELISKWGPPSRTIQNGDSTIYQWNWTGGTTAYTDQYGYTTARTTSCSKWFDVDANDQITGWHWQGDC